MKTSSHANHSLQIPYNNHSAPKQIVREEGSPVCEDTKSTEQMAKHEAAEPKKVVYLILKISIVTFMEYYVFTNIAMDAICPANHR